MNAKELLQMNAAMEQFVAFTTLMRGDLNTEIAAAKQILADLDAAEDLVATKKQVETQKTDFESYKEKVLSSFDEKSNLLQEKETTLVAREQAIANSEKALATAHGDLLVAQTALSLDKQKWQEEKTKAQQDLAEAKALLDQDRAAVSSAQHSLIMREQEVNRKLEVLRNL